MVNHYKAIARPKSVIKITPPKEHVSKNREGLKNSKNFINKLRVNSC
jgi:hypothetical protein